MNTKQSQHIVLVRPTSENYNIGTVVLADPGRISLKGILWPPPLCVGQKIAFGQYPAKETIVNNEILLIVPYDRILVIFN